MSDRASVKSNAGSESGDSRPSPSNTPRLQPVLHRLGASGAGIALTKANLQKNDSVLAKALRQYDGLNKADRISAAAKETLGAGLPDKTKQNVLENVTDISPMQRFLKGTEDLVGGPVDDADWDELVLNDPLAADLAAL